MNFVQKCFLTCKWKLRSVLGLPHKSSEELLYRICGLPEHTEPGSSFQFPWGSVEYLSASDLRGQFSEIFVQRHYAFRSQVAEPVIVDCGGNIGLSAIWFKQTYPKAKLTVYEADPATAKILSRNVASAGITEIDVHNAAVWIENGTVAFDNLGRDKGTVAPGGAIQVRSVDLAAHLPDRVDLLKLDIEGAEYPVIERLCKGGAINRVQALVAEYHIKRQDLDSFLSSMDDLRAAGMQVTLTSALGPWLGRAESVSPFEIVAENQVLAEVYAWR